MKKDDHKPEPSGAAKHPSGETAEALRSALGAYLAQTSAHIESRIKSSPLRKVRRLSAVGGIEVIRGWFAECETLESWRLLVLAWDRLLLECDWIFDRNRRELRPTGLLGTWLRRRGAYAEIAARKVPSAAEFTERLIEDTQHVARERQVVRLLVVSPLYPFGNEELRWESGPGFATGLSFPKGRFDFGGYELWSQPDPQELERFFDCSSNALFFPNSVTSVEDLAGPNGTPIWLTRYAEPVRGEPYSRWREKALDGNPFAPPPKRDGHVLPEMPSLDESLAKWEKPFSYAHSSGWLPLEPWAQEIFTKLLLWRWLTFGSPTGSNGDRVETTIAKDFAKQWPTDPFEPPPEARLAAGAASHAANSHPERACDEACWNSVWFSETEAAQFKNFMANLSRRLDAVRRIPKWWESLDAGLQFMTKSATAEHEAEKFLWSIVALESFLGKKEDRLAERIGKRLARLCSQPVPIQESDDFGQWVTHRDVDSLFKEAYKVRCDIVHGKGLKLEGKDLYRLNRGIFTLAQGAALRLTFLLSELAERSAGRVEISRKRILTALEALDRKPTNEADSLKRIEKVFSEELRDGSSIPPDEKILKMLEKLRHKTTKPDSLAQAIEAILRAEPFRWRE